MNKRRVSSWLLTASLLALITGSAVAQTTTPVRRNIIVFVADGLRSGAVNSTTAPTMLSIRNNGVYFSNSHSLFPTFTTANASAIATGHQVGDTGDFSNTIYSGYPVYNTGNFNNLVGTQTPFVENNQILSDLNDHFNGNYLNEESLMGLARQRGYNTASVGKVGPVAIQDITQITPVAKTFPTPNTIFVDDATGSAAGIPLTSQLQTSLTALGLPTVTPGRGANGQSGNNQTPGTTVANTVQQQYFADVMTKAVLPAFAASSRPFYVLYWSRDPDGSQHNQGDSLNSLTPGINGPTSLAAIKNADNNLAQIVAFVQSNPQLANNTDIILTADHGFSTISKHEVDASGQNFVNDYASTQTYIDATGRQEVNTGFLPVGFLAIDIAHELNLPLWDPDTVITTNGVRSYAPVNPAAGPATATRLQRPGSGDGLIGGTGAILNRTDAQVIVAANGGSDLIYVPSNDAQLVRRLVSFLSRQNYVGGLFVDDMYGGDMPGALPLSSIGLVGNSRTPRPAISVNFKSFALDPNTPNQTGIEIADSSLQEGQGMHGNLSRADTFNNIAAIGPDFKSGYVDNLPMSNTDLVPTIAKIIGIDLPFSGTLQGRVLREALVGTPVTTSDLPLATQSKMYSGSSNGNATVLLYQQVGDEKYYDRSCLVSATLASTAANPCGN